MVAPSGGGRLRLLRRDMRRCAADGLFVDVGGASTELVAFANRQIEQADSVPVGSLKLYRDCVKKILPGKSSCRRLSETIETAFDRPALQTIPNRPHMVCVGGTARAALQLCRKLCGLPEDCRTFTRAQLDALAHELCGNSRPAKKRLTFSDLCHTMNQ